MTDKELICIKNNTRIERAALERDGQQLQTTPNALMEKYITARLKKVGEKEQMIQRIEESKNQELLTPAKPKRLKTYLNYY